MSTRRMVINTIYNCFMVGTGVICTVLSVRDLIRDNDAYMLEKARKDVEKENWLKATSGDREDGK